MTTPILEYFADTRPHAKAAPVDEEIREPGRHRALLSLAGTMRRRGLGFDEIAAALKATNELRCKPPLPETEVVQLVEDVVRRYQPSPLDPKRERLGREADRLLAEWANEDAADQGTPRGKRAAGGVGADGRGSSQKTSGTLFLPFADVNAAGLVRWKWRGKVPESAVTLVAGRPKLGKSLLTVWLAAQLSRGLLEGSHFGEPARTLLIAAEDPVDTIVKARLIAAAADELFVGTLASRPPRPPSSSWRSDAESGGQDRQQDRQDPQENLGGLGGLDGGGSFARRIVIPTNTTCSSSWSLSTRSRSSSSTRSTASSRARSKARARQRRAARAMPRSRPRCRF